MRFQATFWALAYLLPFLTEVTAEAWEPVQGQLTTRWARDVAPDRVLPEYPRPQMVREKWTNLNGLWQYAIRPAAEDQPEAWDGEILVPFAIESALSGVKKPVRPDERLWYRRTFSTPKMENGGRLLLHFGALDWQCTVWVNGEQVGEHTGGYDPFTFDITDALNVGQAFQPDAHQVTKRQAGKPDLHELVVAVTDPTDTGHQPRGKQVLEPRGIWYTAVTGIWQTVWLEPVPQAHIRKLKIVPDVDRELARVTVTASEGDAVRVHAVAPGKGSYAAADMSENTSVDLELPIPDAVLWTPEQPVVYELKIELLAGGKAVDTISSYFGMRKIEVKKDDAGINRLWLNDKVVFQYGPLDQGWWPDGLYTAPTDEALKYDIEMTKRLGFNMARKHVKIEPARWYYWCDRLGLLVWQDMPSGDFDKGAEGKANFRRELQAMIDALHHFPSIVMWVPFNEGWGQHDTEDIAAWTKDYDATRPVNEASGWHDKGSGDVSDMHNYPGPGMREPEPSRVSVLGEFGGLGMPVRDHTWQDEKNWGYVSYQTADDLTDAYVELLTMLRPLIDRGLSAAVYTQTTDVEIEVNGLLTYDRALVKMDESRITAAARKLYQAPPEMRVLVATSEFSPHTWRYTTTKPESGWFQPDFDDSAWKSGPAGFGQGDLPRAKDVIRTKWDTPDIWLRRAFHYDGEPEAPPNGEPEATTPGVVPAPGARLMLIIQHDEDAEVYLNDTLVRRLKGHTRHYKPVLLDESASSLLRRGRNTLAIHCRQTTGGQFIDAGLFQIVEQ